MEWLQQVSVSCRSLPACPYFSKFNIGKDSCPKSIATGGYNIIPYHLTNLSFVLKLLSVCFIFGCLVGDKMNQKDKKSHNQDLSNLALGSASCISQKLRLSLYSISHIYRWDWHFQLVIYPVVNKYFRKEFFPLLGGEYLIWKPLYSF